MRNGRPSQDGISRQPSLAGRSRRSRPTRGRRVEADAGREVPSHSGGASGASTRRAVRWVAPGASQAISSVGNAVLVIVGARWFGANEFGRLSLAYASVLLVSQLLRVALGEASLLGAVSVEDRHAAAPQLLGGALFLVPVLGAIAFVITLVTTRQVAFAVAVAAAVGLVSTAEISRYALLALGLVRRALSLDLSWTLSEFVLLGVLRVAATASAAGVLWCWTVSAAIAIAPTLVRVRPAISLASLRKALENEHWWRLTINESLLTGTSYMLLAVLAANAGAAAVGGVRAAFLPFLWVQLSLAAAWLVVLSRQPNPRRVNRLVLALAVALSTAALATVAVVHLVPASFGRVLLHDNWPTMRNLIDYAGVTFLCLTVAEAGMLNLKALADTAGVLRARLAYALAALASLAVIAIAPSARTVLLSMAAAHVVAGFTAYGRLRRHRRVPPAAEPAEVSSAPMTKPLPAPSPER